MRLTLTTTLLAMLFTIVCGCNSIPAGKSLKEKLVKEKPKPAARMSSFWKCYAQTNPNPGGAPLRGVGGRILFYSDRKNQDPIMVNGDMTIYLFDANDPLPERSVPLRHAIFKKETLPLHHRKDNSGMHGYDFFVPMDEIDGEEMELSALAIFVDDKDGKIVMSKPISVILEGKPKKKLPEADDEDIILSSLKSDTPDKTILRETEDHDVSVVDLADYRETNLRYESRWETEEQSEARLNRSVDTIKLPDYYGLIYNGTPSEPLSANGASRNLPQDDYYNSSSYEPAAKLKNVAVWPRTPNRLNDIKGDPREENQRRPVPASSNFKLTSPQKQPADKDENTVKPNDAIVTYGDESGSGWNTQVYYGDISKR